MNNWPYVVKMEGGDTFAAFQFNADADRYTRNRSKKYPEVVFAIEQDYGSGIMVSCTKRYKAGRLMKMCSADGYHATPQAAAMVDRYNNS